MRDKGSIATLHNILFTLLTLSLLLPKAVLAYEGQSALPNALDLVYGVGIALLSFWLGEIRRRYPTGNVWYFEKNVILVVFDVVAALVRAAQSFARRQRHDTNSQTILMTVTVDRPTNDFPSDRGTSTTTTIESNPSFTEIKSRHDAKLAVTSMAILTEGLDYPLRMFFKETLHTLTQVIDLVDGAKSHRNMCDSLARRATALAQAIADVAAHEEDTGDGFDGVMNDFSKLLDSIREFMLDLNKHNLFQRIWAFTEDESHLANYDQKISDIMQLVETARRPR